MENVIGSQALDNLVNTIGSNYKIPTWDPGTAVENKKINREKEIRRVTAGRKLTRTKIKDYSVGHRLQRREETENGQASVTQTNGTEVGWRRRR